MNKIKTISAVAAAIIGLGGAPAHADPASSAILGVAITKGMDEARQLVEDGKNAGLTWEMQGGAVAATILANLHNLYRDSLSDTFGNGVNPTVDAVMSRVSLLMGELKSGVASTEQDALTRLQVIANSLPVHNGDPQVSSVEPMFVVPARDELPITLTIRGNFEDAASPGFAPSLQVGDVKYQPTAATTQALTFRMSTRALFPEAALQPGKFNSKSALLIVPRRESHVFGLWHSRAESQYPLVVNALPLTPGRLVITKLVRVPRDETKLVSAGGRVCSQGECGNNDRINVPIELTLEASDTQNGWHIKSGSCSYDQSAHGDTSYDGPRLDGDRCLASVTTVHHRFGSSGIVDWTLKAVAVRTVYEIREEPQSVELAWGEERTLPYSASEWKDLQFDAFSGGHTVLNASSKNPFVTVTQLATGKVSISAADPRLLHWAP